MKDIKEVLAGEEFRNTVEDYVIAGKSEKEAIVEAAKKMGYEITPEEFQKAMAEREEVSGQELKNVSGGMFGMGPDAPDGHEIGCLLHYYGTIENYENQLRTGECYGNFLSDNNPKNDIY